MPVQTPIPELAIDGTARRMVFSKGDPGSPDIAKFDNTALNAAIDAAIKNLPMDKHVVAFARADLDGVHFTLAGKVNSKIPGELDWTVYVDKPWKDDWDAGVGVRWSI